MSKRIQLYIMSLEWFFILMLIKTVNIPLIKGIDNGPLSINWKNLLTENISTIVILFFIYLAWQSGKKFKNTRKGSASLGIIKYKQNADYNYLTFLVTYILPFLCFDFKTLRDSLLLLATLALLGAVFVKTNLYYQNPMLALKGYKLYHVKMSVGSKNAEPIEAVVLSKTDLIEDKVMNFVKMDDHIFYKT